MELPSNYRWEELDSGSLPGHKFHRLYPPHERRYAVVAYYKREGKWLHYLPFGEGFGREVNSREGWAEMPEHITTLEEAKAYVETLWRLE